MSDDHTCSICDAPFDMEAEGGVAGYLGMIPFTFCVTCNAALVDYVLSEYGTTQDD